MSDKIVSKNPAIYDFDGYVGLRQATGRQAQYASRYIDPVYQQACTDYPFLGEGLTLMVSKFRSDEDDFTLIPYAEYKGNADYHSLYLSIKDAEIFKGRVDNQYSHMNTLFVQN